MVCIALGRNMILNNELRATQGNGCGQF